MSDLSDRERALEARVLALESVVAYLMALPLSGPQNPAIGPMSTYWAHGASSFRDVVASPLISDREDREWIEGHAGEAARQMIQKSEQRARAIAVSGTQVAGPWP